MSKIGVQVQTGTVGPSGTPVIAYSNAFFSIVSPWGQDGAVTLVDSPQTFQRKFGGLNKMASLAAGVTDDTITTETNASVVQAFLAVMQFFAEKGRNTPGIAYVTRVVKSASGATAASKNFTDGAANNTTIVAKDKGIWGSAVRVTIANPSPAKGTGYAQITVRRRVGSTNLITEVWQIATAQDAANASRKSELVTITLPAGGQLPQTATESKLGNAPGTPGTADAYDASDADLVGTVSGANVRTGLQCFNDPRLGIGGVMIPGKYTATIRTGIMAHAATYDRVGLVGAPSGLTPSTVVADLGTTNGDGAYFWPQLEMSDPTSDSGGTILVDPVGSIMGLAARCHGRYRGPHKSPAGINNPFMNVLNVERSSTNDELCSDDVSNTLDDSFINTVRIKGSPQSIVQWGNATLNSDGRLRQINALWTVKLVRQQGLLLMEPFTHEPIDPQGKVFAKVTSELKQFLQTLFEVGALYGIKPGDNPTPNDAYFVLCSAQNNQAVSLAANELHADIGIVPTPNAKMVLLNLQVSAPGFNVRAA